MLLYLYTKAQWCSSIKATIYQEQAAEAYPLSVPVSGGITHYGSFV